ncbi:MAG: putative capsid protein [Virus sp.]|nr:MAG: putative capsid protein [Virus sp.]
MAYGKKRFSRVRRVKTSRARYKTGAKSQSRQIIKLQKQITRIDNKTSKLYITGYLRDQFTYELGSGGDGNSAGGFPVFKVRELFSPARLVKVFTTTNDFDTNQSVKVKSLFLKIKAGIAPANVSDVIPVTPTFIQIWIVTLRKETGRQCLQDSNNMSQTGFNTVPANTLYSYQDIGMDTNSQRKGNAMLNPAFFKIHAYKSFTLGKIHAQSALPSGVEMMNISGPLSNQVRSLNFKIRMGNVIRSGVGGSPWKTLTPSELQTQDRMWMITSSCAPYGTSPLPTGSPQNPPEDIAPITIQAHQMYKISGAQ